MSANVVNQPSIGFNIIPDQLNVSNSSQKVLIVGLLSGTGTISNSVIYENTPDTDAEIYALIGNRSPLANAVIAFKKYNKSVQVDVIGSAALSGGSPAPAAGTITFSNATSSGTITVFCGSKQNIHSVTVSVSSGDTATVIASAFVTAISALPRAFVTPTSTAGVLTLTVKINGTEGNKISLSTNVNVAGMVTTITGMTGGVNSTGLTSAINSILNNAIIRYQTIVWPSTWNLTPLKSNLDDKFNTGGIILDGVGIVTLIDSSSNLITTGNGNNSQSLVIAGIKDLDSENINGSAIVEDNLVISSTIAAIRSLRLTESANISQYVISSSGVRDSFGGVHMSSFPYFNTPARLLPIITSSLGFSEAEIENLISSGISTLGNNFANNSVLFGEMVTTYKTDSAGNPDPSFKFLNYVDTLSNVREYFQNNLKSRFAQSRLTQGDLVEGHSMANEGIIRSYMNGLYDTLSDVGFVLTQNGKIANKYFNDNMAIEIDMLLGKVTINMKVPIVTQLRQIIGTVQVSFSTEG